MDAPYLTIEEACKAFRVSQWRIRRAIRDGEIPVFQRSLDRRSKLLNPRDLETLATPRPVAAREATAVT